MAVIGIDLGTTNSLAAYWKNGKSYLIPTGMGDYLIPSVVSYVEDKKKIVVGNLAKNRLLTHAENTKTSFKRFMGTEKNFYLGERSYLAFELSAMILGKIKAEAEVYLGERIEEAVVTVPAYFNDKQRSDTKKAAQLAGLSVKRLINEPSAAALAYRMKDKKEDKNLLVFDFGGGTLDISLVECFDDVVEIIGVVGDNALGGDDIDRYMAHWFCEQNHWDYQQLDIERKQQLLRKCEKAKAEFAKNHQVTIAMGTDSAELTEDTLYEICMPLFSKIKTLFLHILEDCQYCISDIDDFIMVGGSSKLPIISAFLTELLGKKPVILGETDCVVAIGAGVYAGIRERDEDIRDIVLTDVCPFTLGVASVNGSQDEEECMMPMIKRNATLPARKIKTVRSVFDYQAVMRISIYQGESYYVKDNLFLGEIKIELPPRPAGEAKVDICFLYDLNGILQVEAINEKGEHKKILLSNQNLTEEEINEKLKNMEQIIFFEELQMQIQQERATAYYKHAVGEKQERIADLIAWYEHEISSGKKYRQKHAMYEMERRLAMLEQYEENLDDYLFDGALKYEREDEEV